MNCHYPAYISACKTAVRLQQDIFFCTDFCKTYFIFIPKNIQKTDHTVRVHRNRSVGKSQACGDSYVGHCTQCSYLSLKQEVKSDRKCIQLQPVTEVFPYQVSGCNYRVDPCPSPALCMSTAFR